MNLRGQFTWSAASRVTLAAGGLVRTVLLARLLVPGDLGWLFLLQSVAGLCVGAAAIVGLRQVAAATASEVAGRVRASIRFAAVTNVALAAAISIGLTAAGEPWAMTGAFLVLLTSQCWTTLSVGLAKGLGHVALAVVCEGMIESLAQVTVLGLCVALGASVSAPVVVILLAISGGLPIAVLAAAILHAARSGDGWSGSPAHTGLFSEFAPTAANQLAWQALVYLPLWIAGATGNVSAAAVYGIAQRVAGGLRFPLTVLATVLAPVAAHVLSGREFSAFEKQLRRGTLVATAAVLAGFIILFVFGRQLMGMFFGPFFDAAWPVAVVLGLTELVNSAAGLGATMLLMMNESSRLLRLSAISAVVLALLAWPLCRMWGAWGLAWATFAAWLLQNVMTVIAVRRLTGIRTYVGFA